LYLCINLFCYRFAKDLKLDSTINAHEQVIFYKYFIIPDKVSNHIILGPDRKTALQQVQASLNDMQMVYFTKKDFFANFSILGYVSNKRASNESFERGSSESS